MQEQRSARVTLDFRILGPLVVSRDGEVLPLGTPQQRAVLAVLVCDPGHIVTRERLIAALWGELPNPAVLTSIRTHVSHLRHLLEPERPAGTPSALLVTETSGYRLAVPDEAVDAHRFERGAARGTGLLEAGDPRGALAAFDEALSLWRGDLLVDLAAYPFVERLTLRWRELRAQAEESRVKALLDLGRDAAALADAERLLDEYPLREGVHAMRMIALYRLGRQSDALESYRRLRERLDADLGIVPSRTVEDLHRRILQQDTGLLLQPADASPVLTAHPAPGQAAPAASLAGDLSAPSIAARPARPRQRRRLVSALVVAGGLGVVLLGAQAAAPRTVDVSGSAVGAMDTAGRIVAALPAGTRPSAVAYAGGSLWVANQGENSVLRIDPDTSAVLARFEVGHSPAAIVATDNDIWVTNAADATVSRINVAANAVVARAITVGSRPEALAGAPGGVWVANSGDNTVQRIDVRTGAPGAPVDVGDGPDGLLLDGITLWVANGRDGTVSRLDAGTGAELASPVKVGSGPRGLARVGEELWVADQLSQSVSRVDVESGRVRGLFVGDGPTSLAVLDGRVWVSEQYAGTLTRIDPATEARTTFAVAGSPGGLATSHDRLWFTLGATPALQHRGGTLTIAAARLPGDPSVDPAEVYEITTSWPNRLVYEGLVALRYSDGQDSLALVPSLATRLPLPSDGGRTYTFELRKGIRYSTGEEVRASDFVRGVRRPVLHGNGDLYRGIVGVPGCIDDPEHCDVSAGVQADDVTGRVTVHLTRADPDFLYKLAWLVFPTPATYDETSSARLPGVGPYQITDYEAGLRYTLARNPYFSESWSAAAVPPGYPDAITWLKVGNLTDAVTAVDEGRADLAELTPLGSRSQTRAVVDDVSIRQPKQVHRGGATGTYFVAVNSAVPPFDNVKVRQALNYAIDRAKLVDLEGGPAAADPSCQMLPAGFPGFEPYCPYTANPGDGLYHGPDLVTARRLVTESGTTGASVRVTDLVGDANPPFDDYIAQVLTDLGYHVTVERLPLTAANREHFYDSAGGVQVTSGGWFPDYQRPSTYYDPIFRCETSNAYVLNYCDHDTDRAADAALALEPVDPGRANRAWADVQKRVVDQAPVVFGVTIRDLWYSSARVGNYQQAEIYGPLFSQMWVR